MAVIKIFVQTVIITSVLIYSCWLTFVAARTLNGIPGSNRRASQRQRRQQEELIPGTLEWALHRQRSHQQQDLIPGTEEWASRLRHDPKQPEQSPAQALQQVEDQPGGEERQRHHEQPSQQPPVMTQAAAPEPARAAELPTGTECSAADFGGLSYRGTECHPSNVWPGGPCPIEGACLPACSRCVNWRRGQLYWGDGVARGAAVEASGWLQTSVSRTVKRPCDSTIWGFGQWRGEDWVPSETYPQCSSGRLSPSDIYQCLRGKRVTLFGDSMIRPLMGRLVAYLRGIPQYIDHLFHAPGGYYMTNGTHDVFVEGDFLPRLHESARVRYPEHQAPVTPEDGWDPRITFEMQFYWAPLFTHYDVNDRTVPALSEHWGVLDGSDIMIAGPMYHEGGVYDTFRDEITSYFNKLAHARKRISHFFWVATIPTRTDTTNVYEERNNRMRAFVEMLNEQALYGNEAVPQYSYYVDAPRMVHGAPAYRFDGHLFQCNKHGIFPMVLTPDYIGLAADRDCRDVFNLNLVQTILKVACNA